MKSALKIDALQKSLGKFNLGPIDLDVQPGTALGFVGQNGAGKSTTIHCLLGLLKPERGEVYVCDQLAESRKGDWKRNVGFVLSQQCFYERLTVYDNLKFFASFYADWDQAYSQTVLRRLQIGEQRKVKTLSTGERIKLALAGALSHRPMLLVLDEPTASLDPIVRAELIDLLSDLIRSGDHAIFMSTHILADISALADDVVFINNGKIVSKSTKDDLLEKWRRISFRAPSSPLSVPGVVTTEREDTLYLVTTCDAARTLVSLKQANAEILETTRLTVDEISDHILRASR